MIAISFFSLESLGTKKKEKQKTREKQIQIKTFTISNLWWIVANRNKVKSEKNGCFRRHGDSLLWHLDELVRRVNQSFTCFHADLFVVSFFYRFFFFYTLPFCLPQVIKCHCGWRTNEMLIISNGELATEPEEKITICADKMELVCGGNRNEHQGWRIYEWHVLYFEQNL